MVAGANSCNGHGPLIIKYINKYGKFKVVYKRQASCRGYEVSFPWLQALAKPVFSLLVIYFTAGNFAVRYSILLSEELLSTTITSASMTAIAFCTEQRHCSRKSLTL